MKLRRYHVPKLSLALHVLGITVTLLLTATAIRLELHRSSGIEALWTWAGCAGVLWAYFTVILYRGLRFDHGVVVWPRSKVGSQDMAELGNNLPDLSGWDVGTDGETAISAASDRAVDLSGWDVGTDGEGLVGLLGAILVLAIGFIILVFGSIALTWLIEVGWIIAIALAAQVYCLFRYSMRAALVHTRTCKGRLGNALTISAGYALGYASVLALVMWIADAFIQRWR